MTIMGKIHSLTRSNVKRIVPRRTGVYRLYKSQNGPVRYVGSSKSLHQRLKDWASDNKYRYFEYEFEDTIDQAYKRESALFHQFGGTEKLDNEKHPPRPTGRVKCPSCSLHD